MRFLNIWDLHANKIINVLTPTAATDAAPKSYADAKATVPVGVRAASGYKELTMGAGDYYVGPVPIGYPQGRFTALPYIAAGQASTPAAGTGQFLVKAHNLSLTGFDMYAYIGSREPLAAGAVTFGTYWFAIQLP